MMVTNTPHLAARGESLARPGAVPEVDGAGARVLDKVRQLVCGLHGHDNLLQFERDRMFLRCVSCGHETPGWEISETPPPPTAAVRDEPRPTMVRARLEGARRIA